MPVDQWLRCLPAFHEYLSREVSLPAPFPASSTPEQPAHSPHPDNETADQHQPPPQHGVSWRTEAAPRSPV